MLTEARLNTTVSVARAGEARSLVSLARGPAEAETPQRSMQKQDAKKKLTTKCRTQTRVAAALPTGRDADGGGAGDSIRSLRLVALKRLDRGADLCVHLVASADGGGIETANPTLV